MMNRSQVHRPSAKVAIVGNDGVTPVDVYALLAGGFVKELLLLGSGAGDLADKIRGLCRFVPLPHQSRIRVGEFKDLTDVPVVVIPGSRGPDADAAAMLSIDENISEFKRTAKHLRNCGFRGLTVIIGEPVDILAQAVLEELAAPPGKVIGLGRTAADFAEPCCESTGPMNKRTVWCTAAFTRTDALDNCDPACPYFGPMLDKVALARDSAEPGPNDYPAACVTQICRAVINDTHDVIRAYCKTDESLGFGNAFVNLPCMIGSRGVEQIFNTLLTETDRSCLERDAAAFSRFVGAHLSS
jgi:L-lactate dehydrogenase